MNEHISLVKKWLNDPDSVSKKELRANLVPLPMLYMLLAGLLLMLPMLPIKLLMLLMLPPMALVPLTGSNNTRN